MVLKKIQPESVEIVTQTIARPCTGVVYSITFALIKPPIISEINEKEHWRECCTITLFIKTDCSLTMNRAQE
jgi:hypothetical protein